MMADGLPTTLPYLLKEAELAALCSFAFFLFACLPRIQLVLAVCRSTSRLVLLFRGCLFVFIFRSFVFTHVPFAKGIRSSIDHYLHIYQAIDLEVPSVRSTVQSIY